MALAADLSTHKQTTEAHSQAVRKRRCGADAIAMQAPAVAEAVASPTLTAAVEAPAALQRRQVKNVHRCSECAACRAAALQPWHALHLYHCSECAACRAAAPSPSAKHPLAVTLASLARAVEYRVAAAVARTGAGAASRTCQLSSQTAQRLGAVAVAVACCVAAAEACMRQPSSQTAQRLGALAVAEACFVAVAEACTRQPSSQPAQRLRAVAVTEAEACFVAMVEACQVAGEAGSEAHLEGGAAVAVRRGTEPPGADSWRHAQRPSLLCHACKMGDAGHERESWTAAHRLGSWTAAFLVARAACDIGVQWAS
eukprot:365750-Chlamydomonas_euryale.AAC.4